MLCSRARDDEIEVESPERFTLTMDAQDTAVQFQFSCLILMEVARGLGLLLNLISCPRHKYSPLFF